MGNNGSVIDLTIIMGDNDTIFTVTMEVIICNNDSITDIVIYNNRDLISVIKGSNDVMTDYCWMSRILQEN